MKHPIAGLITKYLSNELDDQEKKDLDSWISASDSNRLLFEKLTDQNYLFNKLSGRKVTGERILKRAKEKIEKVEGEGRDLVARRRFFLRWISVAAVVLGLVVSGYWLLNRKSGAGEAGVHSKVVATDAAPGKYKARLTLSNGSTIVLDSADIGKLSQQGNVDVINKDGKLVYVPSAKSSKAAVNAYNTLTTAKGETFGIQLSDGSKIWLNSGSSIRYPVIFAGPERRVEITGEAYFEVSHDRSKPFIVGARGMEVEVLATVFNINAYEDENVIKTTLAEGRIKVKKNQAIMVLKPGQQVQATASGLDLKENADVERALAWKNGYFQFENDNLKTVMRQLARWYDVEIVYKGSPPETSFVGEISMQSKLSEVLTLLEKNDIHFQIESKKIVVSP